MGEPLEHDKYGKCPSCNVDTSYACTCDSGSYKTIADQLSRAKEKGYDL